MRLYSQNEKENPPLIYVEIQLYSHMQKKPSSSHFPPYTLLYFYYVNWIKVFRVLQLWISKLIVPFISTEDAFSTIKIKLMSSFKVIFIVTCKSRHEHKTKYNLAIVIEYHEATWNEVTVYIW